MIFSSRYDGRGHLASLAPHEAGVVGEEEVDELERQEEELVEEERWRSLLADDVVAEQEEEGRKREGGGRRSGWTTAHWRAGRRWGAPPSAQSTGESWW